ncbi:MAG: BatD family protein [Pseudomonadota bacterium]
MTRAKSGNHVSMALVCLTLTLMLGQAVPAQAALTAALDRYRIAMGDTVRLTLKSDDESDPGDADLSALQRDFEVLQRSSSVSSRIVYGQRKQTRELLLEITPRREGSLVIPPFVVAGKRSEALAVDVGPEPEPLAAEEVVIFEAEVDATSVYVQGQILLTLRVQQAVNLDSRSITELQLENAYVETLGQNSFQRTIDGRPWLVHEIRYAIFPESSGTLSVPKQLFSGRLASGRRSLFDTRPAGRLIRRESDAIDVAVLPRPTNYPKGTWLPASRLTIEEQWSAPLQELRIGDSVTRTVTVTGDGLMGAQLPPFEGGDLGALRAYPDQPVINSVNGERGVTGIRTDSVALVAVAEGEYEVPAVEIPWWDTETDSLQIARLPARRLTVLPAINAAPEVATRVDAAPPVETTVVTSTSVAWPIIAFACGLGWLLTGSLLWREKRRVNPGAPGPKEPVETSATLKAVLNACGKNDAPAARQALGRWVSSEFPGQHLGKWLIDQASDALSKEVGELDLALYGQGTDKPWDGSALASALKALSRSNSRTDRGRGDLPALYLSQ